MKTRVRAIAALDVYQIDEAVSLVRRLAQSDLVYGFKVGFALGLGHGLGEVVRAIKEATDKPVVYDHQKAGSDIPDTGPLFASTVARAGVDEAILFAHAGPAALEAWVRALQEEGITCVVGALMTHERFLISEGGFVDDTAPHRAMRLAHDLGVRRFVLPMTKPDLARAVFTRAGLGSDCVVYSPGVGAQGGAARAFELAGEHLVIVGRSLRRAADPLAYVESLVRRLEEGS